MTASESPPRPEYPRPHFDRSHTWRCLNGTWDFARDPLLERDPSTMVACPQPWPDAIAVPFPWDSEASGVAARWCAGGWYRRDIEIPSEWQRQRVVLHFGAVHHDTIVWVGEHLIGRHEGGYLPFEFDITDALSGDTDTVTVRVVAPVDKRHVVHGKQRSVPPDDYDDCAFSPSSGIWQSVWLEARPATYIRSLRLVPTADLDGVDISATVTERSRPATVEFDILGAGAKVRIPVIDGGAKATLSIDQPRRWSPSDPHLYDIRATLTSPDGTDVVQSYTGLRSITTAGDALLLNGERISIRGVLDQGYWPDSSITAASDEAFVIDLELARRAGFNLVRKHLKTEDPRFLYHADRTGTLIWAEPACTGRFSAKSTAAFEAQIEPMVERDANHPSIVIWGLYNEEWGLDWDVPGDPAKQTVVRNAVAMLRRSDQSRPIVDNSGWAHVDTDLVDWHVYTDDLTRWRELVAGMSGSELDSFDVHIAPGVTVTKHLMAHRESAPLVPNLNSEYGSGFTSPQRGWHQRWQTQELRRHDNLSGYVWTELYDIEHEMAGIYTYTRRPKDLGGADPALSHSETTLVFDVTPYQYGRDILTDNGLVRFDVHVSHHGAAINGRVAIRWLPPMTPITFAELTPPDNDAPRALTAELTIKPFQLSEPINVTTELPPGAASGRLLVTFGNTNRIHAAGFVDVERSE